jgi:hypothetical protein
MKLLMYSMFSLLALVDRNSSDPIVKFESAVRETPGVQEDRTATDTARPNTASRAEMNSFPGMVKDFITISYNDQSGNDHSEKVYGLRNKNKKDTLHVEGDILMNFPTKGTKGVGTQHVWGVKNRVIYLYYRIDPAFPDSGRILRAFQMWASGLPIKFVHANSLQNDYAEFIPSFNTQSYVGREGGRQTIEISSLASPGNVCHEIGHALGLYHEMSRKDRDQYVLVICGDDVNYMHAFESDPYAIDLGGYDFYSIMHYPTSDCMQVQPKYKPQLPAKIPGQRDQPSAGDFQALKTLYHVQ